MRDGAAGIADRFLPLRTNVAIVLTFVLGCSAGAASHSNQPSPTGSESGGPSTAGGTSNETAGGAPSEAPAELLARCPELWDNWEDFRAVNALKINGVQPFEGPAEVVESTPARLELLAGGVAFWVENAGQLLPTMALGESVDLRIHTAESLQDSSYVAEIRDASGRVVFVSIRHMLEEFREAVQGAIGVDVVTEPLCDATNSECTPRTMLRLKFGDQLELQPFQSGTLQDAQGREYYTSVYYAGDTLYRWDDVCQVSSQVPSGPYVEGFLVGRP